MSKVTINVDTSNGECDVSIDGQKLENITEFYGYKYSDGYFSTSIRQAEKIDDGTWKMVQYVQSGTEEAKASQGQSIAGKLGDFVKIVGGSKLVHDISQFLRKR